MAIDRAAYNRAWKAAHPETVARYVAEARERRRADPEAYYAKRRNGRPYGPPPRPAIKRFWPKVDTSAGVFGCWPWLGAMSRGTGYGRFWLGSDNTGAHRAAYELLVGAIPDGLSVLHSCDNPACVNPAHLRVGTQADNVRDEVLRGRHRWQRRAAA